LDSSVWIAYLLKDQGDKADRIIDRLKQGDEKALVSTLVILEVMDVMRKRITERENFQGMSATAKQQVEAKADAKIREFMDMLTKLAKQGKVAIVDPDIGLIQYLGKVLGVHQHDFGELLKSDYCPICRAPMSPRYRYKGPGLWDIQHAFNARECTAQEIISFDQGFDQLRGIHQFDALKITVL
jgi:predicted nucleic acid-binding protein